MRSVFQVAHIRFPRHGDARAQETRAARSQLSKILVLTNHNCDFLVNWIVSSFQLRYSGCICRVMVRGFRATSCPTQTKSRSTKEDTRRHCVIAPCSRLRVQLALCMPKQLSIVPVWPLYRLLTIVSPAPRNKRVNWHRGGCGRHLHFNHTHRPLPSRCYRNAYQPASLALVKDSEKVGPAPCVGCWRLPPFSRGVHTDTKPSTFRLDPRYVHSV